MIGKIKQLVWRDNATDLGKEQGLVCFVADDSCLALHYKIQNSEYGKSPIVYHPDKFFLGFDSTIIECVNIQEAKALAQEDYEKKIQTLFFEPEESIKEPNITPEVLNKRYITLIEEMRRLNKLRYDIYVEYNALVIDNKVEIPFMHTPSIYHDLKGNDLDIKESTE